jgi:HD-GYP domain-containing protein (c-di-GMP phosphodiesterase class II)
MTTARVSRYRIVTALLAALIVVSIVPLVISTLTLVKINREALETAEKKYLTRSAVTLAQEVDTYLRNAQVQLRRIADGLALAGSTAPDRDPFLFDGTSALLADYVGAERSFVLLRALNKEGQGGVAQPVRIEESLETDLSRAFSAALRRSSHDAPVVGEPFRAEGMREGGIVMAVPVHQGERTIGVVEAVVSLGPATSWLAEEKRRDVLAYIVDRRGKLILASDREALPDANELARVELVGEFIAHPVRLTKTYAHGSRHVLGTVAPVDFPDWGVIVEKDEASAFASAAQMTNASTLGALLALLFAAVVASVAARTLSRPVVDLVAKVRLIGQGNLSERVEVQGVREFAELAETFNSMAGSLEQNIEKLKQAARENQELFLNSIRTLAAAIDAKDPYTRGHSERVARYAVVVARHFGLSAEEIRRVRISALLHDVGKIGIDDRILRKPTALTDEEFEVMKTHPVKGALIMGQIPQLKDVIPGIKHHHEKWEGGGYPDGLVKTEIPLIARIVSVADTFDAMTTTRPYQKAMQLEFVVSRIKSFSGTRFDPDVVVALGKAFETRDLEVVGEAARLAVAS